MSQINMQVISKLCDDFYSLVRGRPTADSIEQEIEWNRNRILYWQEESKFICKLSDKLRPVVFEAVSTWTNVENHYLNHIKKGKEDVFVATRQFHDLLLRKNSLVEIENLIPDYLRNICGPDGLFVKNVGWIHMFNWILPVADPATKTRYLEIGKMMVAAFYVNYISGRDYHFPVNLMEDDHFFNIEAEYQHAYK